MQAPPVELMKALQMRDQGALFIDARTPAEYAEATIPGAINVPILSDEERVLVGTLYKQQGADIARQHGIELISPKIPSLLHQVQTQLAEPRQSVVVFCWRGGLRSRALTAFLSLAGVRARQLIGGHKAFRRQVLSDLETGSWGRLFVLRGLTGVGKTGLLHRLDEAGVPVVDLEGLAHHRGSTFGALGLPDQPVQKMFDAALWDSLRTIPKDGFAVTEGESRQIGKLRLPDKVYEDLQVETSIWIEADLTYRVQQILEDYPVRDRDKEKYRAPIESLTRRLGRERTTQMLAMLEDDRWQELVEALMVDYYDPLYQHTLPSRRLTVKIDAPDGWQQLENALAALRDHTTGWIP